MMMFGQLSNQKSLRDLVVAMEAHAGKLYHLGIGKSVTQSNLSKANDNVTIASSRSMQHSWLPRHVSVESKIFELDAHVYTFDSTTIDLCLSVFEWTKIYKHKGRIKLHTLYDIEAEVLAFVYITPTNIHDSDSKGIPEIPYESGAHYIFDREYNDFSNLNTISSIGAFFVVRANTNVRIKPKTRKWRLPETVVYDIIGCFMVDKSSKNYLEELRKLIVKNPEDSKRYILLTNNLDASAQLISSIYRNRWSVELFFKWIKWHLRIKKFWGTSENAVRIHIYCAIITYCLVAIAQHDMKLERRSLWSSPNSRNLSDRQNTS